MALLRQLHRTPLEDRWPHEDLLLKSPHPETPTIETSSAFPPLMWTSAFAVSVVFHFITSFIPSAPWWLYFTAHRLQCRDSRSQGREINKRAPALPFFPFLFGLKDKVMFSSCFGRLRRVVIFGAVTDEENGGRFLFSLIRWMLCRRGKAGIPLAAWKKPEWKSVII